MTTALRLTFMGRLADIYYERSEYTRALELYEKVASLNPDLSAAHLGMSLCFDRTNRPDEAIESAKQFRDAAPDDIAFANLHLGKMLQNGGFYDESLIPLKKAAELTPKSGAAYFELSESYEAIGDKENTLINLRKAYSLTGPDLVLSRRLGWALTGYGRMAEAVEPLEQANRLRPNDPAIMTHLGLAYFESNDFDKAVAILIKADELEPNNKVTTMYLGVARARRETLLNFQEVFDKVRQNPRDAEARTLLAMAYRYRGMPAAAEAEHLEAIRLDPKNGSRYKQLAIFYSDTGQTEKAIEYDRKAVELRPNHVYYWSIANNLRKLGRLDEAIEMARKSLELKPAFVEARLALGELLEKKGDRAAAVREYQTAFDFASGDERPNFKLASAYIRMGNKEGSMRHYQILKGIAPNHIKYLAQSIRAHFGRSILDL